MPRRRRTAARTLTLRQRFELVGLGWYGQCEQPLAHADGCNGIGCWSVFDSEEERRAAYMAHRGELVRCTSGFRPQAFWVYEAPSICRHKPPCSIPRSGHEEQVKWLRAHDQLTPHELAVMRQWEAKPASRGGIHLVPDETEEN